jgi:DNA-binding HxlR family transcriptional regulator
MTKHRDIPGERCPVKTAIAVLSGRWKPLIVYYLRLEKRRFSELHRLIPEASRQVLTQQLRQLEKDEVIVRIVHSVVPPRVEYELSPLGRELEGALDLLEKWGERMLAQQSGGTSECRKSEDPGSKLPLATAGDAYEAIPRGLCADCVE